MIFLNGLTNPFITYAHEMREKGYRFDDIFIGLNHTKNFWFYSIGIGERNDYLSIKETDIKTLLRNNSSDIDISEAVITAVQEKEPGHLINEPEFIQPIRTMSSIGG